MAFWGVGFALGALLAWGFGDFFIQRATRAVGIWKTLLAIGALGMFALYPFARNEIFGFLANEDVLVLLGLTVIVVLFTTLFIFEAPRQKGVVLLRIVGAAFALSLVAVASRMTSPLVTVWILQTALAAISCMCLFAYRNTKTVACDLYNHWRVVAAAAFFVNLAWVLYAFAVYILWTR